MWPNKKERCLWDERTSAPELLLKHTGAMFERFFGRSVDAVWLPPQLESITRNTRRMAGMMEEVLILSRLDAGKLIFRPSALDLNIFCPRVVDEVLGETLRRIARREGAGEQ